MKVKVFDQNGQSTKEVELPIQFSEPIRLDLIKRAVLTIQSNKIQPYGVKPEAGKRQVSYVSKRRNDYKSTYGIGQSRTPRKIMSRSGSQFNWTGAFAPQTVGGREAHPPKASKIWALKINKKEMFMALRSAISASALIELVKSRGHHAVIAPVILDGAENLKKTSEIKKLLQNLKLDSELERVSERSIRAGKGKARGRKYKVKKGPLFIVSKDCDLLKSAKNLLGIDVAIVDKIDVELLAPGTVPGRLTIWTLPALERMNKEALYL